MKDVILLIIFLLESALVYPQAFAGFLGKNRQTVKKEMSCDVGLTTSIKSGGYDGLSHQSRSSSVMFLALFNKQGICFLNGIVTKNKNFVDLAMYKYCNDNDYTVSSIDPEKCMSHDFVNGKATIEMYTSMNSLDGVFYTLYSFTPDYRKDVESFFENKYAKEYAKARMNLAENECRQNKMDRIEHLVSNADDKYVRQFIQMYFENKLKKESEYWDIYDKPVKKNIDATVNVVVYVDSMKTKVVYVDNDEVDVELGELYRKARHSDCLRIWDTDYYECNGGVFYCKEMGAKTDYWEKGLYGVEKNKKGLYFYTVVPDNLKTWCDDNLKDNGFHVLLYTNYNDSCIIKEVNVNNDIKRRLKRKY